MDLSPKRTTVTYDDQEWLGSRHGVDCTDTGTLDLENAGLAAVAVDNGDGTSYIPSGIPVNYDSGTKLYELAADTVACDGHVYEQVVFNTGSDRAGFALFWHGKVILAKLPDPGYTFGAADGAPHIRYV